MHGFEREPLWTQAAAVITLRSLLLFVGLALWFACGGPADPIALEGQDLQERLMPADGRLLEMSPVRRDGKQAHATWTVSTGMTRQAFEAVVRQRLQGYREVTTDGRRQFRRVLNGDAYTLALSFSPAAEGRVRVQAAVDTEAY
jgi:hypothetical protein